MTKKLFLTDVQLEKVTFLLGNHRLVRGGRKERGVLE